MADESPQGVPGPTLSMSAQPGQVPPSDSSTLPPGARAADGVVPLLPNDSPPDYEIIALLGRGGMGVVYQARQLRLNRLTALKMILAGRHAGAGELARFRREAEAVARLHHPGIVQIYAVGEHQGLPFLRWSSSPAAAWRRSCAACRCPRRRPRLWSGPWHGQCKPLTTRASSTAT